MEKEIDIIALIRSTRYIKNALGVLLPPERIKEIQSRSDFVLIDPEIMEEKNLQINEMDEHRSLRNVASRVDGQKVSKGLQGKFYDTSAESS